MKYQRYAAYKDSGVEWLGDVPEHWEVIAIKRKFRIVGGSTPKSDEEIFWDGEIIWVTPSDLSKLSSLFISDSQRKITENGLASCGTTLVPKNSIILSTRAPIGSLAITETELCTNQGCKSLIPSNKTNSKFFGYLLSVSTTELNVRGKGTTFLELSGDELGTFKIPTPSISEQQKIANFLDHETAKIDTLIEKQRRLIELLKEKRQAVISHAVTKGLNPNAPMKDSGVEWLGEVPEHWSVSRIKHLSFLISKGTTPSTIGGDFVDEGIRFLKAENIGKSLVVQSTPTFYITEKVDEQISRSRLKEHDVLVIIAGATTGLASIVSDEVLPANTNQAVSFIRPLKKQFSKLIIRWLSTEFAQRIIWMEAVQAAQPNLSMEDLGNIPIVVPPFEELNQVMLTIDNRLVTFDHLISKAESAIELMQERRTALISAAVTGKIDVRQWQKM